MAILVRSSPAALARWRPLLTAAMPERDFRFWPELGDSAAIDMALVWQPEPGLLLSLPNLKLIVSLGAGVDGILADPTFPRHLPVVRLVDPYMTDAMSEYVVLQVLRLHRQDLDYAAQQRAGEWHERVQKNAAERRVGILGFGTMGQDAGRKLKALGFDIAGWSRTAKEIPGVATYAGAAGLDAILAAQRDRRLAVAADPRNRGHPRRRRLRPPPARRRDRQCRARPHPGRGRSSRRAKFRPSLRRGSRRLPKRALAARPPVLAPPAHRRHPAYRRRHPPVHRARRSSPRRSAASRPACRSPTASIPNELLNMIKHLLAVLLCLAPVAALSAEPSRHADPGCAWKPFESPELGIKLLVQDCTDPSAHYVFSAKDGWLEQHRPSDDTTYGSPRVIRVLAKPADQPIEAAIRQQFIDTLADKTARASCKVAPDKETAVKGAGKQVFELVPTGAYAKKINCASCGKEPRDFGCGDYGKGQATLYFEYHPGESKTKFIWVDAGQDAPLFDENSIEFIPP